MARVSAVVERPWATGTTVRERLRLGNVPRSCDPRLMLPGLLFAWGHCGPRHGGQRVFTREALAPPAAVTAILAAAPTPATLITLFVLAYAWV